MVRIGAKHPDDPLRAEFEAWTENDKIVVVVVLLFYVPSQQLWSLRDGQFT